VTTFDIVYINMIITM